MPIRRALALRPVVSLKHENTWTFLAQNASTNQQITQIIAVESPVNATEVDIGSIIKSIYVEFNVNGVDNSGASQVFHWQIIKIPAGLSAGGAATYNTDQKKFILKRGMEMLPQIPVGSGGTVQTKRIFVVKLPPRIRRFDDNDSLLLQYQASSASGINFCGISIFKEFK